MWRRWRWSGVLVILALVGCRGQSSGLDDVVAHLAVTPDPPHVGSGTVVLILRDVEGQPIVGAKVELEGNMNHAGMVPVLAEGAEVSPGRYEASLEFTMGGDWFILARVTLPDGRFLEHRVDVPGVSAICGTPGP